MITGSNLIPNPTTGTCTASGTFSLPVVYTGNNNTGSITISVINSSGYQSTGTTISPIVITADVDFDGISTQIENAGPNNGDANGD